MISDFIPATVLKVQLGKYFKGYFFVFTLSAV